MPHVIAKVQPPVPKHLLSAYVERYGIPRTVARMELFEIGYGDELAIQAYEQEGIEWEYKVEGLSGDMLVVPKRTPIGNYTSTSDSYLRLPGHRALHPEQRSFRCEPCIRLQWFQTALIWFSPPCSARHRSNPL